MKFKKTEEIVQIHIVALLKNHITIFLLSNAIKEDESVNCHYIQNLTFLPSAVKENQDSRICAEVVLE